MAEWRYDMLNNEICAELSSVGLNCSEMIQKFMDSEEMFLKYFKMFFQAADSVVDELFAAIQAGDYSVIENRAHALKGLSGNIGLYGVYDSARNIVDEMRAKNYGGYKWHFEKLQAAYKKAKAIAEKL